MFEPGKTGNPNGRPKGKGKPVSRLRQLEAKLKLLSDQSIELIKQELDFGSGKAGAKPVDKDALATAKWTVTTYTAVRKAALSEEQAKTEKPEVEDKAVEGSDEEGNGTVFTLKMA